jgi:hypothetical protein
MDRNFTIDAACEKVFTLLCCGDREDKALFLPRPAGSHIHTSTRAPISFHDLSQAVLPVHPDSTWYQVQVFYGCY